MYFVLHLISFSLSLSLLCTYTHSLSTCFFVSLLSPSFTLFIHEQGAMSNDQVRELEVIIDSIIKTNNPVFAKEASLPLAKEVQGLRACFDEVCLNLHIYTS